MAGIELRLRISISQPIGKFGQFIRRLVVVEQMKSPDNSSNRIGTSRKDILQAAMSTTGKEQAIGIQSKFVAKIVVDIVANSILHKQMTVAKRHRMRLTDMGNNIQTVCYHTRIIYKKKSLAHLLGPFGSYAVQTAAL